MKLLIIALQISFYIGIAYYTVYFFYFAKLIRRKAVKIRTAIVFLENSEKVKSTSTVVLVDFWQGQKDLNPRHVVLETTALPTELYP